MVRNRICIKCEHVFQTEESNKISERTKIRCAIGDAACLCEGIARDVAAENRGRNGRGAVTKLGLQLEAVAKRCSDTIWAMRKKVEVSK